MKLIKNPNPIQPPNKFKMLGDTFEGTGAIRARSQTLESAVYSVTEVVEVDIEGTPVGTTETLAEVTGIVGHPEIKTIFSANEIVTLILEDGREIEGYLSISAPCDGRAAFRTPNAFDRKSNESHP